MKKYIEDQKNLPEIVKKILIFYYLFTRKNLEVSMKILFFLIHQLSNKFYPVYILLSIFAVCDQRFAAPFNYWCFVVAFTFFFVSAIASTFLNNESFGVQIENFLGEDFSKKYIKKNKDGVYVTPFLFFGKVFFAFIVLDILTNSLDNYNIMIQLENLATEQSLFYGEGNIQGGREIVKESVVIAKIPSKGVFTKLNIVINWYFTKNFF